MCVRASERERERERGDRERQRETETKYYGTANNKISDSINNAIKKYHSHTCLSGGWEEYHYLIVGVTLHLMLENHRHRANLLAYQNENKKIGVDGKGEAEKGEIKGLENGGGCGEKVVTSNEESHVTC